MSAFKRGWLRRGRIYSDDGFSVATVDRTTLLYRERGMRMTIAGEMVANGFVGNRVNLNSWDDGTPVATNEQNRIAENIIRAFASQGMVANFD